MLGRARVGGVRPATRAVALGIMATLLAVSRAAALIEGGEGNDPIDNPRWEKGVATVFNDPTRVAYWVGPPFGGGQWHGEYRGDAAAFNAVLVDFAKLEHGNKRLVIHDGVGQSFWLNLNDEPDKRDSARIDWKFTVWEHDSWKQQQELPVGLRPADVQGEEPPIELEAYAGGNIKWADVVIPPGVEVVDQRLEAHGFALADGVVIEGHIAALDSSEPLAARVVLERIEPRKTGGYDYPVAQEATADANGQWVMKNVPAGWYRIIASSEGYVDRVVGHVKFADQPAWMEFHSALAKPGPLAGIVADDQSKPLAGVQVVLRDVAATDGSRYEGREEYSALTDAEGRFRIEQAPVGTARVSVYKDEYVAPGLGRDTSLPAGVALMMSRATTLHVTVDFGAAHRAGDYLIEIEPEGGNKVGSWGGSATVDADGKVEFRNVPAGKYKLTGRPNPGREDETAGPVAVDVHGDEQEISLDARAQGKVATP